MARRKTTKEYYQQVNKINPNIIISGEYLNGDSKITCECKICGYLWTSTARNLIYKKKCLNCLHVNRIFLYPDISHEEFCSEIKEKYPDITITGVYRKDLKLISCTCKKCGNHSRVRTQMLLEGTYKCAICDKGKENVKFGINDIKTINPVLYENLLDKDIANKYTINSRNKVDFICPSCGNIIKNKSIEKTNRCGLKCKCQDGNSLGEKYFFQVIKSVDSSIEVEKYLNSNYSFRYDFYGNKDDFKWICEIQGKQHNSKTFETCGGRTLTEEIENDERKKKYAKSQGVNLYVEIDSKESGLNQLKAEILSSELTKIYDFSNVDWIECYRKSMISDVIEVSELWKSGKRIMEICSITGFEKGTVRKHLTKANELHICEYDHKKGNKLIVKCIDTGEIFDSLRDAETKYGIKRGYISRYLKGIGTIECVKNKRWEILEDSTAS